MPSNMVFATAGRTLVIVHNKDFPTDAEWDGYLAALREHRGQFGDDRKSLVVTDGGAPSSRQRERMSKTVEDHVATTSVVSASKPVLATVGALNLKNREIRAFPPTDIDSALAHLGLRDSERAQILSLLPALKAKVGVSS